MKKLVTCILIVGSVLLSLPYFIGVNLEKNIKASLPDSSKFSIQRSWFTTTIRQQDSEDHNTTQIHLVHGPILFHDRYPCLGWFYAQGSINHHININKEEALGISVDCDCLSQLDKNTSVYGNIDFYYLNKKNHSSEKITSSTIHLSSHLNQKDSSFLLDKGSLVFLHPQEQKTEIVFDNLSFANNNDDWFFNIDTFTTSYYDSQKETPLSQITLIKPSLQIDYRPLQENNENFYLAHTSSLSMSELKLSMENQELLSLNDLFFEVFFNGICVSGNAFDKLSFTYNNIIQHRIEGTLPQLLNHPSILSPEDIQQLLVQSPNLGCSLCATWMKAPYKLSCNLNFGLENNFYQWVQEVGPNFVLSYQDIFMLAPHLIHSINLSWDINKNGLMQLQELPECSAIAQEPVFQALIIKQTKEFEEQFQGSLHLEAPIFNSINQLFLKNQ